MRRVLACLVVAAACVLGSSARADQLIWSDFETGAAGWTTGGPENLEVASFGVLGDATSSGSLWSYNATYLPLYMSLDLDYLATGVSSADPFVVGLHIWGDPSDPLSMPSGDLQDHYGYFLAITESTSSRQTLALRRRNGPTPADLVTIGSVDLAINGLSSHHLRWTDCGCGRLTIFVDDMITAALYVDDKPNYIGRTGTRLGVGMPGEAAGWIDNVLVEGDPVHIPEPTTMLLALIGAAGLIRRRQVCPDPGCRG